MTQEKDALLEAMAEVVIENDYWSRGHFYKGSRKCLKVTGDLEKLPIGTKLFLIAGTDHGADVSLREVARDLINAMHDGQSEENKS